MPERIDLDAQMSAPRRPIDAEWSKPKKIAVSSVAGVLATAGLAWGIFAFVSSRPPSMPTTAEEAVLALASQNFDRLDGERQDAIRAQAVRLLAEAPPEERQRLRDEIELTEAGQRQLREAFMENMARQFARGEQDSPFAAMMAMRGGGRPGGGEGGEGRRGPRPDGQGRPGGGGGSGEGEGDGPSREERQQQFRSRIQDSMANGNAQTMALIGEFFTAMRAQREQGQNGGGNGRRGGGGGGGG